MFRKLLLGSAMILTFAVAASAQTDWKGFYAGGNLGDALGRATADTSTVFTATGYFAGTSVVAIGAAGRQKLRPNGVTGGGEAGFNGQSGHIVYGVEADFDVLRLSAAATSTATYPCCTTSSFTVNQSLKTSWMFTARPRIGYTTGHALLYATGGLAMTNVNYQEVFTDTFAAARETGGVNQHKTGWTGGLGVEYQLPTNKHWSVKGEYLYLDFGRTTTTSTNLTAFTPVQSFPSNVFTHSLGLRGHIIRGGINYRW